jgi:hypothetical protein
MTVAYVKLTSSSQVDKTSVAQANNADNSLAAIKQEL